MVKIDVYTDDIDSLSERLRDISSDIDDIQTMTADVRRGLNFRVAARRGIQNNITKVEKKLKTQSGRALDLAEAAALSAEEFRNADGQINKKAQNILGKIAIKLANAKDNVIKFFRSLVISRHKAICDIFLTTGAIVLGGGSVGILAVLKQILEKWRKRPDHTDPGSGVDISGVVGGVVIGGVAGGHDGTGTGASENTSTDSTPDVGNGAAETPVKPEVVNTGSAAQNAVNAGMTYYTQGKDYNKYWDGNAWLGADGIDYSYKAKWACGICCDAMIATYFGVGMTPGQLIGANGGTANWDGAGVKKEMEKYGITMSQVAKLNYSPEAKLSALDECLANYQNDPAHHSPPMVTIYSKNNKDSNHYVLVVGKDSDGNYIIINPSNNERTTLKVNSSGYGRVAADKKGYESVIKSIFTWTKK